LALLLATAATRAAAAADLSFVDLARLARTRAAEAAWTTAPPRRPLSAEERQKALDGMRQYLQAQQLPDGLFRPELDLRRRLPAAAVDPRRQAAAVRAAAVLAGTRPSPELQQATLRALQLFASRTGTQACGAAAPVLGEEAEIHTQTVASLCLALQEFLHAQQPFMTVDGRQHLARLLDRWLDWLKAMEMGDGSWAVAYIPVANERNATADPATDALCLLAYATHARRTGRADARDALPPLFLRLAYRHIVPAWRGQAAPQDLIAFAPAAAAAAAEYAAMPGAEHAAACGDLVLGLAWWFLHELDAGADPDTLVPALEVLASARRLAIARGDAPLAARLEEYAEPLLARLLRRQVNGPRWADNPYARGLAVPRLCSGGFVARDPATRLRLDAVLGPAWVLAAWEPPAPRPAESAP
jgi:hypothetical protein